MSSPLKQRWRLAFTLIELLGDMPLNVLAEILAPGTTKAPMPFSAMFTWNTGRRLPGFKKPTARASDGISITSRIRKPG